MRLYEDIDFTTLTWVKPELDETLRQARIALESFVEDPGDVSQMRYCATYLHQVHGTLRMVELYGAAMVAEEMEQLARKLAEPGEDDRDEAYAVLMRGIVQLPDYLERLQGGHRDIPIVLLPLLNELREARGEKGLGESALFSPDLGRELPESAAGPAQALPAMALREQAEQLREQYQAALLQWLRDDASDDTIAALTAVCDRLVASVSAEPARRLFWVAGGTLEALRAKAFEASKQLKQALGRVEREIKRLADEGEASFRTNPPLELTRQLLYYVAHASTDHGRIREMRDVFLLDRYLPSEAELAHARGSMTGHNRALLDTVSSAIKDDLLRVKDALDLHMRSAGRPAAELAAEADVLDRVGDTLGMLGLGVPRRVVQEQREALLEVASGQRQADEGTLLDIAGALLYVEASLDDQVAQLGHAHGGDDTGGDRPGSPGLSPVEARTVLDVVVREAISNFAQARQCFVAFVETSWDSAQLNDVPQLLDEVGGALRMLEVARAPDYLLALRRFTCDELLEQRRVPNPSQLETLADALSSLEYFLEALRDQRGGRDRILDTCEQRLGLLGVWPLATRGAGEARAEAGTAPQGELGGVEVQISPEPDVRPDGVASLDDAADLEFLETGAGADADEPAAPPIAVFEVTDSGEATPDFVIEFDESQAFPEFSFDEEDSLTAEVPDASAASIEPVATPSESGIDARGPGRGADAESSLPDVATTSSGLAVAPTGFEGAGEEIDDEIREVFLEELQEEIENLAELLPTWRSHPEDLDALRPIRRVFHTLKGSGRLVGALTLGEFSWRIENALNRLLDNSRPVTPAAVALVESAQQVLPEIRDSLAGIAGIRSNLDALQQVADRVAAGEEAFFTPVSAPTSVEAEAATGESGDTQAVEAAEPALVESTEASAPAQPEAGEDEQTVPVALDPVLFEILKVEVHGHLETVDAWVAAGRASSGQRADDPLLRAVHTMNGAFAMTEIPVVTELTAPLEGYIKRLLAARRAPSGHGLDLVEDASAAIRRVLASLDLDPPRVPLLGDLPAKMGAERDTLPEPTQPIYGVVMDDEPESIGEAGQGGSALLPDAVDLEEADTSALPDFEVAEQEAAEAADTETFDGYAGVPGVEVESLLEESDAEPEVAEQESEVEAEPEAVDQAPEAEAEPEVVDQAPEAEAEPEVVEQAPEAEAEPEVVEQASETEAEPEVAEQAPEAEAEPEVAEQASETEAEPEVVEQASETEAEPGVVEQAPEAEAEPEQEPVETLDEEELLLRRILQPEPDPDAPLDMTGLDEELLDLFLEEAQDLLDHSDGLSAGLREAPEDREIITGLQRDLHTLKGGARMAGIAEIGELGHVMESLLEAVAEGRRELGRPGVRLVEGGYDRLHRMVTRVIDRQALSMPERLIAAFEAASLGRALPVFEEPSAQAVPLDAEVGHAFEPVEEGPFGSVETDLAEAGAEDAQIEADAWAASDDQDEVRPESETGAEGGLEAGAEAGFEVEVEAQAVAAPEEAAGSEPEPEPQPTIEVGSGIKVEVEAETETGVEAEVHAQPQDAARPAAAEIRLEPLRPAARELPPLSPPLSVDALGDEEDAGGIRSPQEQVRIRADLLDRLVNYAGEVAIYRARLEQQLGGFRSNLAELDATNSRLREQLRKLEIETEAQIIARYQRETDDTQRDFDPLELDRFSTLQQLTRALSESASDLVNLQGSLEEQTRQYETLLLQQSRVSSDLQEGLMRTRMVPFDSLVPRLRRVLRQASSDSGKQAQLKVEGASGEMDRNVLERMTAPLEHMLRNAVAHGLELPADRRKAGKAADGEVTVGVSREGSEVVITVSDDGRGLDFDAIRQKAISRGLLKPEAKVSDDALAAFILETGFSTAGEVSRLAGRGVGMDVVYNEIRQLGGALSIKSRPGEGTQFQVRLPFTLAVTQAVFVRIGDTSFAIPIASVQGVGRIARDELEEQLASEQPTHRYAGEDYAIHDLGRLIGHAPAKAGDSLQMPVVLARSGELRAAICVDQVLGSREIVVKPTGPQVSSIPGIFGATVMGDGSVVIILDVAPLVRRQATAQPPAQEAVAVESRPVPLVMVVDDSITMRKVSGRVLERNNYEVVTAKDGVDAIEKMAERVPDLMLLDIEMPRMDGYELATHMRNDARLAGVPIIMITSRTGEKHRQRAFEIGVNRYLGKPYQEAELIRNVQDLLATERSDD